MRQDFVPEKVQTGDNRVHVSAQNIAQQRTRNQRNMGCRSRFVIEILLLTSLCNNLVLTFHRVCYFPPLKLIQVSDIDPFLCTHIVFAFAKIHNGGIAPNDKSDTTIYRQLVELKKLNPKLKLMLSIQKGIGAISATTTQRERFAESAVRYLKKINFDGIDLDWEHPTSDQKQDYVEVMKSFRQMTEDHRIRGRVMLISAAVTCDPTVIDSAYDIPEFAKVLDFVNLMTYDFHTFMNSSPQVTGLNSPFLPQNGTDRTKSLVGSVEYWVRKGMPKSKIMVGLPTYGRTYKLSDPKQHTLGAPASAMGERGPLIYTEGFCSYPEVCLMLSKGGIAITDNSTKVPYAYIEDKWVTYDDVQSFENKCSWIRQQNLGGAMVWQLQFDDADGQCGGRAFPLLNTIKDLLPEAK